MRRKSYLSKQYKLLTFTTSDFFTDEEYELYLQILDAVKQTTDLVETAKKNKVHFDKEERAALVEHKRELQFQLDELIKKHDGNPRSIRIASVVDTRTLKKDECGKPIMPDGVTWNTFRQSRRIAEFFSDFSRTMGLVENEVCMDKIIVKWKSAEVLRQLCIDGFTVPFLHSDGSVENKPYRVMTASAGQLRTDKVQFISLKAWAKIQMHVECGLDWTMINAKGGINPAKELAYTSLGSSATYAWPELDIDHCIVIDDFEGPVTGMMKFINPDYTTECGVRTVMIKHTDGIGMALPEILDRNAMVRGPYLKGLLTVFDYIAFCRDAGVEPKLKDSWGKWHDLAKEHIQCIFTASQLKLWKYYDSWDHYKRCFKACGWTFSRTNDEEDWIPDTTVNYQFLETLVDFTDDEIRKFCVGTWDKIHQMATSEHAMLKTLKADELSDRPYSRALSIYPALLRDGYARGTLKAIKKRWTQDAKSGRIICKNKRLFAIPDMYAACEHWFLGEAEPKGLLADGEVACRVWFDHDEVDCLRSPHLSMEHAVRKISHDPKIYRWLKTKGIYTSCHDLISRILQFDCDGDQLNAVVDETIIEAAKRNVKEFGVIPLFYDANSAPAEMIDNHALYKGIIRAHESSGIGQISNNLCKLWNSENPDFESADLLCYFNNQVIDGAKTGMINSYEQYPEVSQKIMKAVGGKNGRMPYFFQFSRNGRHANPNGKLEKKQTRKIGNSTMDRICKHFSNIGNINMNYAGVAPFNWLMFLEGPVTDFNAEAVNVFCGMDSANLANVIDASELTDFSDKVKQTGYDILKDRISQELVNQFGSLQSIYPSIVKALFTGPMLENTVHKQMFWRVFGNIAVDILERNLVACKICSNCGEATPLWVEEHVCKKDQKRTGLVTCIDCGKITNRLNSRQCRCPDCQEQYRIMFKRKWYYVNAAEQKAVGNEKEMDELVPVSWDSSPG